MRTQWHVSSTQRLGPSEFSATQFSHTLSDADNVKHVPFISSITVFLFVVTSLLALGIATISPILASQTPNPLAPYQAIMPGQSDALLESYNCRPVAVPLLQNMGYCEIAPHDPVIQRITITSVDSRIQNMAVALNDLRLGYLLLWWGEPDSVEIHQQFYIAMWGPYIQARGPVLHRLTHGSLVQMLSFDNRCLSSSVGDQPTFTIRGDDQHDSRSQRPCSAF